MFESVSILLGICRQFWNVCRELRDVFRSFVTDKMNVSLMAELVERREKKSPMHFIFIKLCEAEYYICPEYDELNWIVWLHN